MPDEFEYVIDYKLLNQLKLDYVGISKQLQIDYTSETGSSLFKEDVAAAAGMALAFKAFKKKKIKK